MPYKDTEKQKNFIKNRYVAEYKVRIKTEHAAINSALVTASEIIGCVPAEYLRLAAREKLIRDGFLTKEE